MYFNYQRFSPFNSWVLKMPPITQFKDFKNVRMHFIAIYRILKTTENENFDFFFFIIFPKGFQFLISLLNFSENTIMRSKGSRSILIVLHFTDPNFGNSRRIKILFFLKSHELCNSVELSTYRNAMFGTIFGTPKWRKKSEIDIFTFQCIVQFFWKYHKDIIEPFQKNLISFTFLSAQFWELLNDENTENIFLDPPSSEYHQSYNSMRGFRNISFLFITCHYFWNNWRMKISKI